MTRPEPPKPDPGLAQQRTQLALHAFETAGRLQLLIEHMEAARWRTDGYSPEQLAAVANELRGTAVRAALASGDAAVLNTVTGRKWSSIDPPGSAPTSGPGSE